MAENKIQTIRRNIERISDLARLCDYMMCASLLDVARAAAVEIESLVSNPPKKYGYFLVLLCLGAESRVIELSPSFESLTNDLKVLGVSVLWFDN